MDTQTAEDIKKQRQREASRRYAQSEKGKANQARRRQTESYKDMQARWRESGGSAREYIRNKDRYTDYEYRKKYGITLAEYYEMLEDQAYKCYICGVGQDEVTKKLSVDHHHDTGKVRKLLCVSCNTALGHVKENIDIMKKMIDYVEEHS